jgi:hypothetical protein
MLQSSLLLIAENPLALLTGGFTEIYMNRFYSYNQLVHNLFAYLTLQFGLATMLAWVLWVLADMRRVGKVVFGSIDRSRHLPGAVLIAVFFSIFLYGQTYSMLDSVQIGFWLLFWLGIARQASRRDKLCAVVVRREARFVTDPVVPRQVALTEVT